MRGSPGYRLSSSTSCSGWATGRDRSISVLINVKIAVFAPMPSASEMTATAVNPGERRSVRAA